MPQNLRGRRHIWERIWEKGPIGNFSRHENKFDYRENTLSNAANHFKIFLIEFEIWCINICTSCTLGNPYSQLLSLFPWYGNLKLSCFIQKIVFRLYKTLKSAVTFDRGACSTHCLQY